MTSFLDLRWANKPPNVAAAFSLKNPTEEGLDNLTAALRLPAEPVWLQQVHGCDVLDLDRDAGERAFDAVVTSRRGMVCAIRVADCLPVLFAARDGSRIGAAHAGWRGLAGGVLEATVEAMQVAPDLLTAWIGPGICQDHFEVGEEVREAFVAASVEATRAFAKNANGRWQCDLPALAAARLQACGVRSIETANECTFAAPDRFHSYRRDGRCGRMAALLWKP